MKQCISIALALFLAAAVSAETAYPVSVTTYDKDGKAITQVFKQAPKKVITNNLSMTEMLIELGLQDRIIGMLDPDNAVTGKYKKAINSIPHIGNKKTVSREVVFSYEPDAVLGRNMMFSEKSLGTVSFWNENGIPIYAQKASVLNIKQDLQNIIEDVRNLGIIFNVQDKAEAYAKQLEQRLNAVLQHISTKGTSFKKALIMCAYNGTTFGAYKSALQESLLNVLGYTNIATGTSGLTTENLITMNPELIIYVTSDRNKKLDANAVSSLQANVVLVDVPAIAQRKIMTISYDELMDYGPAVLNALEAVDAFLRK